MDTPELIEFLNEKREEFRKVRKDDWIEPITSQLLAIEKKIIDLLFDLDH
jgi:hypothetical protein